MVLFFKSLVILFSMGISHGEGNSDVCGKKLNVETPTFHQGKSRMCGSYSTAQLLSSQYRVAISPNWVSLISGTFGGQEPTEVMEAVSKKTFLCQYNASLEPSADELLNFYKVFQDAARELKKRLGSLISLNPSDRMYSMVENIASREGFESVDAYVQSIRTQRIEEFRSKIEPLFFSTFSFGGQFVADREQVRREIDSFVGELLSGEVDIYSKAVDFSLLGYSKYCTQNKAISKFRGQKLKREILLEQDSLDCSEVEASLDTELNKGFPSLVGLNFEFLYGTFPESKGSDHYLAIVEKRCLPGKEPEYLIRNSYGKSCGSHDNSSDKIAFPCNNASGEFWIPLSKICSNAGDLYVSHSEATSPVLNNFSGSRTQDVD